MLNTCCLELFAHYTPTGCKSVKPGRFAPSARSAAAITQGTSTGWSGELIACALGLGGACAGSGLCLRRVWGGSALALRMRLAQCASPRHALRMDTQGGLQAFIGAIIEAGAECGEYTVVRAALSEPDTAIIVYEWMSREPLFGRVYSAQALYAIFSDEATAPGDYAGDVITHDFGPQPGAGRVLNLDWEAHLGLAGRPVHWGDVQGDVAALNPVLIYACR